MEFTNHPHLLEVYKQAGANTGTAPENNEDMGVSGLVMGEEDLHKKERARAEKHHAQALAEMSDDSWPKEAGVLGIYAEALGVSQEKVAYITASERGKADSLRMMMRMLSILVGQYHLYYDLHWKYRGRYGDHLLFSRLYETVQCEIDGLAEKVIGYHGDAAFSMPELLGGAQGLVAKWDASPDPLEKALAAEKELQNVFHELYDLLKAKDLMPMGLDDYIMAVCNKHEDHTYLLQQLSKQPRS